MTTLQGKTALVTGASSGIGRAIALQLARCKVNLCLVGRNEGRLREVREKAKESSDTVVNIAADLGESGSLERLVAVIEREFNRLDILVHSAGAISLKKVEEAEDEDFQRQLAANVVVPYLLTKGLLPFLAETEGQIVFINSSIVFHARAGTLHFAASQHALKGLADSLRAEVNERGIRVLSVFPGRTATPRQQYIHQIEGIKYRPERLLQPQDVATIVVSSLSLAPTAEVTDIHLRPAIKRQIDHLS